jgi:hypothetical protein
LPSSNDITNPNKDTSSPRSQNVQELHAKIYKLRDTILEFSKIEKETHRSVKQQLLEIIEDAKRLNIDVEELRRMLNEEFCARGPRALMISTSYLRRLLPPEYKNSSKARQDYKVKQKLEQVRTDISKEIQNQVAEVAKEQGSEEIQLLTTENNQQKEEIESLQNEPAKSKEEEGQVWTATGILEMVGNQIPLLITVNSKERKIENVEIDR